MGGVESLTENSYPFEKQDTNDGDTPMATVDTQSFYKGNPSAGDGTLTIKRNGTVLGTFTAKQSGDTEVDITVPVRTSQLDNDSGFVSDQDYVHTDNNFTDELHSKLEGVESGAQVNVQADWNQTDASAQDYIKNKPLSRLLPETTLSDGGKILTVNSAGTGTEWKSTDDLKAFKGWFDSSSALSTAYHTPQVGDYAYVKGSSASDPAAIYECATAGTWSDSERTVDTSSVQTFASNQEVNDVHIIDDLTTGGSDDVLSAEQGVALREVFVNNNYEYKATITGTNPTIKDLKSVNFKAGTVFYVYPDNESKSIRITEGQSYTDVAPGNIYTATNDVTGISSRQTGERKVHILINQTNFDEYRNPFKYDKFSIKNLISKNVVADVQDFEITSTTSTTNIFPVANIPLIPSGSVVHIDTSDFSSFATNIRFYINGSSSASMISNSSTVFTATDNIERVRVAIADSDFVEGATGGVIDVTIWWEDAKYILEDLREKSSLLPSLDKDSVIQSNPSGYDESGDKFTAGQYDVIVENVETNAEKDIIVRFNAKYLSSNDNYPTIKVFYNVPPLNNNPNRFVYTIGGKDCYKNGECKCVSAGSKGPFSQPSYNPNYRIRINVPQGCELYLTYINMEYDNRGTNKDTFRVFNHGMYQGSNFNAESNWDGWNRIGCYGAVVVPKQTTDGKWVCYHNDSFGETPDVQVIGTPSAALPAASMQQCTFAQTQTLEYVATNNYGEHDRIATLQSFFTKCSITGVHPMLSIHPALSESQLQDIKSMAKRYGILNKLTIKGSYSLQMATLIYNVFGNTIEAYMPNYNSPSEEDIEDIAGIGWDLNKVAIGFEYLNSSNSQDAFFDDETIEIMEQYGLVTGYYCAAASKGEYIKDLIENKLLWEYTSNYFFSNGLNW